MRKFLSVGRHHFGALLIVYTVLTLNAFSNASCCLRSADFLSIKNIAPAILLLLYIGTDKSVAFQAIRGLKKNIIGRLRKLDYPGHHVFTHPVQVVVLQVLVVMQYTVLRISISNSNSTWY